MKSLLEMTADELLREGFCGWEENEDTIYLIPADRLKDVPDGAVLISIRGDEKVKGVDHIDTDVRGRNRWLAYGWRPLQVRIERIYKPESAEAIAAMEDEFQKFLDSPERKARRLNEAEAPKEDSK